LYISNPRIYELKRKANGSKVQDIMPDKEKVLIIEDDLALLDIYSQLLTKAGYDVSTASNGEDGFNIYKSNPDFAMIILDMVLPGIQGDEVLSAIQKINPSQQVIICTGDTTTTTFTGNVKLLQKPFLTTIFLEMVKDGIAAS
jgi:DNA-binding NtrC family response regulator